MSSLTRHHVSGEGVAEVVPLEAPWPRDRDEAEAAGLDGVVEEVAAAVRGALVEQARADEAAGRGPVSEEEQRQRAVRLAGQVLEGRAAAALRSGQRVLGAPEEARIVEVVAARVCGAGPLEELLAEPGVRNIHLTSEGTVVDFGGGRREQRPSVVGGDDELVALVRRLAAASPGGERRFDDSAPLLSMELGPGVRLSAVMAVSRQVAVTIRRHPAQQLSLEDLARSGMVDAAARALLESAITARLNVLISGATGAGKTTLLRALAAGIDPLERIVTIEDAFELGLDEGGRDCVALQARPANTEGAGEVGLDELVRHALRLAPDRVIVGETRGAETLALLNAMNMGCDGSLGTIHASSSHDVFAKISAYLAQQGLGLEAAGLLSASALDLVVHVASTPQGGGRVSSIREVVGAQDGQVVSNEIYHHGAEERGVPVAPPSPALGERLAAAGYRPAGVGR